MDQAERRQYLIRALLDEEPEYRGSGIPADAAGQKQLLRGLMNVRPHCGRPMSMNLRADDTFVEDAGWHDAAERYSEFLRRHQVTRTLFLELGTGYNTPGIIKYPFWQMTARWPQAEYACINLGQAEAPDEIAAKSICINADAGTVLQNL